MKIALIIWWQVDSTLRPTMKHGFDIIPACAGIDMSRALEKPSKTIAPQQKSLFSSLPHNPG
jgi:hypothetical protein